VKQNKKIIVIGLDCAAPKTLFEDFLDDCPNIKNLMNKGVYGKLKSCDPPVTVPAWMVMATGKDPGKLGVYGFRHRRNHSYVDFDIVSSYSIKEPRIWDIIGEKGLVSCIIGIPPSYPVQPINGYCISGFLAPDVSREFTYPPELKIEIKEKIGDYILDIKFRIDDKDQILQDLYKMTNVQFETIKYLIKNKNWDFFQFVIIGIDRIHHGFWKFYDKNHPKYKPDNKYEFEMKKFYSFIDTKIGQILELLDKDTIIFIVSDHGAKAMKGCISVNMALEQLGLFKLKNQAKFGAMLNEADIDWDNTYAWGWGGYEARIFLNMKGREKNGIIKRENYDEMRDIIAEKLKSIKDDEGNSMQTKVFKPEQLYSTIQGEHPDLLVYFDDLCWRAIGTIGYDSMYLMENDRGPDDAVHDHYGIFIIYDPNKVIGKNLGTKNLLDIAPTILNLYGFEIPNDMEGIIIKY
jgi:predicted AlkP superfamily phosphohydrolase/phosphomutase